MGQLVHEITPGESLYDVARNYNTDIQQLEVLRDGKVFDLGAANNGFNPESLGPSDTVLVPDSAQDPASTGSCEVAAQDAAVKNPTSKLTSQAEVLDNDCAAASNDPLSATKQCNTKKWVVVIDPGHGGTSSKDNIGKEDSSWNNAVGAISNVLEKTMTQRFAGILKRTIETRAKSFGLNVEVLLTKSDENKNLSVKDRARVAKDARADFFIVLHFNSVRADNLFAQYKITKRVRWEQPHLLDITPGFKGKVHDQPPGLGFKRRLFSVASAQRGPQLCKIKSMPKGNAYVTSEAFSASVKNNVLAALKKLDSTKSIAGQADSWGGVGVLTSSYLGNPPIVACCYLESDYISVESGDRTWNPEEYSANIAALRPSNGPLIGAGTVGGVVGPLGLPFGPAGAAAAGTDAVAAAGRDIESAIHHLTDPPLPVKDATYEAASNGIADAIFEVIGRAVLQDVREQWEKLKKWWDKQMNPGGK